jgi:hypothetical protein
MLRTFLAFLALCGVVMAVEQRPGLERQQLRAPTKGEMYERDPEVAEVREWQAKVRRGEMTLDEAIRQYRAKKGIPMPTPGFAPPVEQ